MDPATNTDPSRSSVRRPRAPAARGGDLPLMDRPVGHAGWRQHAVPAILLGLLVLLSTGATLRNGFVYDDVFIVRENPSVQRLLEPWQYFSQSYWYATACCSMYRPLTVWLLALQWQIGDGAPWVFHAGNLLLYLGLTFAVYAVARRQLGAAGGWAAAALFAVHPVHVEVTGNVVGQAELTMSLASVVAALWYLRMRSAGDPGARDLVILGTLTLAACSAKEEGLVLPGLLAALELTLVRDPRPWRERLAALRPLALALTLAIVAILAARFSVLGGLGAGPTSVAFTGLDAGGRTSTMFAIVPEWFRLLLWPAHLSADYSPPAFGQPGSFDARHAAGVLLLVLTAGVAWWSRHRAPVVTSGILWAAIAMLPMSNVFLPTGIVLAERTLLLPSVGAVLAAGAAFEVLFRNAVGGRAGRVAVVTALVGVLAAGTLRSASRQVVWRENRAFFEQMQRDAPGGYRSYSVYGAYLAAEGSLAEAADQYRRAASLYHDDPRMSEEYAQVLRRTGRCAEAIPILEQALAIDRMRPVARTRLFLCLLAAGEADSARSVAREGTALGLRTFEALEARADSALARGADRRGQP